MRFAPRRFWLLPAAMLLLLSGCMQEKNYVEYDLHAGAVVDEGAADAVVNDMDSLARVLEEAIRRHEEQLSLQLMGDTPEIEDALQAVLQRIMKQYPYGVYAVSTIAYQTNQILSYYQISFDIAYSISSAEMENIRTVGSVNALTEDMQKRMTEFQTKAVYHLEKGSVWTEELEQTLWELYRSDPMCAYGLNELHVQSYGTGEDGRILAITLDYAENAEILKAKATSAMQSARILTQPLRTEKLAAQLFSLHQQCCEAFVCDTLTEYDTSACDANSAYGALCLDNASSEGYALAWKLLCDQLDIPCKIVRGTLDGHTHTWNLVQTANGHWAHFDLWLDDLDDGFGYGFYGRSDAEMRETHIWDSTAYPVADAVDARALVPENASAERSRLSEAHPAETAAP